METILMISFFILFLGVAGVFIFKDKILFASSVTVFIYSLFIIMVITIKGEPSAMDVYQGKTELKYTVVGNEKVDSVVVFKYKKDSE